MLARSLVRSLVGLVATLFGVAGLYMLMAAPFIAFMQILIYVGGVSVLIFFAIMLTHAAPTGDESKTSPRPQTPERDFRHDWCRRWCWLSRSSSMRPQRL